MFGKILILSLTVAVAAVNGQVNIYVGHGDLDKHGAHVQCANRNWKECAWDKINEHEDSGIVKSCSFEKKSAETYLNVVVATNMRITNCDDCCARWFVSFDGQECKPVPIDGVVFMLKGEGANRKDLVRPRVIRGNCHIGKTGSVNVQLQVGRCAGYNTVVDALTGWISATRIYVEEVVPPQV